MSDAVVRLTAALADRYRIDREIGAGGMATVYLAHDIKHERDVAIKVLHPDLGAALGGDRFLSEIRTTARLQHPHILPLLDSGDADGLLYYVMPLVTGETLRARLQRERQLSIADAVRIAREVASALDYAHRQNVIHRDIKPENILLHDGSALVADFGIALAVQSAGGARMTQTGLSLGTPQYMSPEQAMGERTIDARSDVYALGAVLYEMLAGDAPFTGSSVQAIVARVLTEKPPSILTVRDTVPRAVERAVLTALAKLPADRFATAGEFALALTQRDDGPDAASDARSTAVAGSPEARRWRAAALIIASALVATGVLAAAGWLRRTSPGPVVAFTLDVPEYAATTGSLALAPDGSRFVYFNAEEGILVRDLADLAPKPLSSIDELWTAVFSPDGKSIAAVTGAPGALTVYPIRGGSPRVLVPDSTYGTGVAWQGDWIYYLRGPAYGRDLMRIPSSGGPPEFLARPDTAANALIYYWPQMLPGGKKVLLKVYPIAGDPSIGVLDLASGKLTLLATGSFGRYASTGHLLVLQNDGTLQAARFDAVEGTLQGAFTTVAEGIVVGEADLSPFTLSGNGTLLYAKAAAPAQVVRVSRTDGREEVVDPEWRGRFGPPSLSPDGTQLAVSILRGGRSELWLRSLTGGTSTRLSAGGTTNYRPSWTADGRQITFISDQRGLRTVYQVPTDGSAPARKVLSFSTGADEALYTRDGRWLVYRGGSGGGRNIFAVSAGVGSGTGSVTKGGADSAPRALVATAAEEFSPSVSPDGRWLAYGSDETGRTEIFVRPFPDTQGARYAVSRAGGSEPVWSHSGKELFYRDGANRLVAAEIAPGPAFRVVTERVLFSTNGYVSDNRHRHYTVSPDDRTFYFVKSGAAAGAKNEVVVVLNWFDELMRKVGR